MNRPTDVLLLHGMGKSPLSMCRLGSRLRRAGMRTHYFGYSATLESFAGIVARLRRRCRRFRAGEWLAVGHSLGGLLLRAALAELPNGPRHLFTLGTPNRSPMLARRLKHRLWFRLLHGDAGQLLGDSARMQALPPLCVRCTAIVGTRGWVGGRSPFGDEPNDGVVTVCETALEGAEVIQMPLVHTFIMDAREVAGVILDG